MTTVLRRHFPKLSPCPKCRCQGWVKGGSSTGGDLQYRTCRGCGHGFKVSPIGVEVEDGRGGSVMVDWRTFSERA
ncbi:MAG: hypothetical protein H0X38_02435 [Planctomycetes bacterium]|nr:hypothetical protein [Planctomycetota bacterium]